MKYKLASVCYYYPYESEKGILNPYEIYYDDLPEDKKKSQLRKYSLGVLADYYDKALTEEEADDLLCDIIKRHPYIDGAMKLKIEIYWYKATSTGIYRSIVMDNKNYDKQQKKKDCEQIRWEK